jgi:hypothetical protein
MNRAGNWVKECEECATWVPTPKVYHHNIARNSEEALEIWQKAVENKLSSVITIRVPSGTDRLLLHTVSHG